VKDFEEEHRISNGNLGKLFSGQRRSARPEVAAKIATALNVSEEWLLLGRGPWPEATGTVPQRRITHDGTKALPAPIYESVEPPIEEQLRIATKDTEARLRQVGLIREDEVGAITIVRDALHRQFPNHPGFVNQVVGESEYIGKPISSIADVSIVLAQRVLALIHPEKIVGETAVAFSEPPAPRGLPGKR